MNKKISISPAFVDSPQGRLFVTEFLPISSRNHSHTVVFVPPFAEEMNRCRRMISDQGRSLAENGVRVVVFDLYGTGDSAGDFSEASWELWQENLSWLITNRLMRDCDRYSIVAIRLGALLAFGAEEGIIRNAKKVVLWHPCTSGRAHLREFLRLRLASQLNYDKNTRESIGQLMEAFESGRSVEVAGYEISSELAISIEAATLDAFDVGVVPPICWYDILPSNTSPVPMTTKNIVQRWSELGWPVVSKRVLGDQFWSTVETATVPQLIEMTTSEIVGS